MVQRCLTYFTFCASAVSRCGNSRQPREQLSRKWKSERVSQSLLHPPFSLSLLFLSSPSVSLSHFLSLSPEALAAECTDGCSLKLSIKRRMRLGRAPRAPATSCPWRSGLRAALSWLPSHTHFHHSLFTFTSRPSPSKLVFQTPWPGLSWRPPLPSQFGAPPRAPDEYSAFVIASSHLLFI